MLLLQLRFLPLGIVLTASICSARTSLSLFLAALQLYLFPDNRTDGLFALGHTADDIFVAEVADRVYQSSRVQGQPMLEF